MDSSQETGSPASETNGLGVITNGTDVQEHPRSPVEHDLDADERYPSRVAPSAEGIVTFAGLPGKVRTWLTEQLEKIGANDNGNGNGAGRAKPPPPGDRPAD